MLDFLCREIVPDLHKQTKLKTERQNYFDSFKELLTNKFIDFLCFEHTWLNNISTKQKLCWVVLATCCSKVIISYEDFNWIDRYFSVIQDFDLGRVFCSFCERKKLTKQQCLITSGLPDEVKFHPFKDLLK